MNAETRDYRLTLTAAKRQALVEILADEQRRLDAIATEQGRLTPTDEGRLYASVEVRRQLANQEWESSSCGSIPETLPLVRNRKIATSIQALVPFWVGDSPGTRMTIGMARKAGAKVFIRRPQQEEPESTQANG
jgi:hypothetical protein